jgi:hypothetical protein
LVKTVEAKALSTSSSTNQPGPADAVPWGTSIAIQGSAFLLRPRALWVLLAGSLACALVYCLCMFDLGFLAGTAPYWHAPRGLVFNSWADQSTTISGYYYFVRGDWGLPVFQTARLGAPDGTNIIFTDSIPIIALLGRCWYDITGQWFNPYGAWTAFCFTASALAMTGLVATLGQRGLAAALMSTVSGLCMPALLARWGHLALMGQWVLPLALTVYFAFRASARTGRFVGLMLLISSVTLLLNPYLFAMVAGIVAAALAQATIDRRWSLKLAALIAIVFAVVLASLAVLSGYVSSGNTLQAKDFGLLSLNVLSPLLPQFSALLPTLALPLVGPTAEQYEGFSYLGAGTILLVVLTIPWLGRAAWNAGPKHACLVAVLIAFIMFAISNRVYAGAWHIVTIPLPPSVLKLASIFRTSGRFVWPAVYLLTAVAVVAAPSYWGRAGGVLLVVAALLQIIDIAPLRAALVARTAVAAPLPLAEDHWEPAIAQHKFLHVLPPYSEITDPRGRAAQTTIELQLLASRANVATNTVYSARERVARPRPETSDTAPDELRVYLKSDPNVGRLPDAESDCMSSPVLVVCSHKLGPSALAALLANQP